MLGCTDGLPGAGLSTLGAKFKKFLEPIDRAVPPEVDVNFLLDN